MIAVAVPDVGVEQRSVRLNKRMYIIWKFPGYVTSYHQDTHVPPQITLYNQTSGQSVFHFLPMLVGLYVSLKGKDNVNVLAQYLKILDDRHIGSVGA